MSKSQRFTELEKKLDQVVRRMSTMYQTKPPLIDLDCGFRVTLEGLKQEKLNILREMEPIAPGDLVTRISEAIAELECDIARGKGLF
jgi:hypothetical protein